MGYSQTTIITADQGFIVSNDILFADDTSRSTGAQRIDHYRWMGTPSPYSELRVTFELYQSHPAGIGRLTFQYLDGTGTWQTIFTQTHDAVAWVLYTHDIVCPWSTDARLRTILEHTTGAGTGTSQKREFRIKGLERYCLIE